jgi:hypothetical protein
MRPDVLVMADRHIIEGRKRIARQIRRIRTAERRGQDTSFSHRLLDTMRRSLDVHEVHRNNILDLLTGDGPAIHM